MFKESEPSSRMEQKRNQLGILASGESVFDRPQSHIHDNQAIEKYLPLALSQINPQQREFIVETVEFPETIGESICVETDGSDEIIYARRPGRTGLTRFVQKRNKELVNTFTVILKKINEGYLLVTAFVGPKAEPEPWDPHANEHSEAFWNSHALVWGTEEIIPGSETKTP